MNESANNEYRLPIRIYIEDTDAGGIVYYVNYLKFMERARTEFMRNLGYGKTAIFDDNCMFVVHSVQADYLKPAQLDDEVVATAKVVNRRKTWLMFEQHVQRGDSILCKAMIKVACVDRCTLRPAAIPNSIQQHLATLYPAETAT